MNKIEVISWIELRNRGVTWRALDLAKTAGDQGVLHRGKRLTYLGDGWYRLAKLNSKSV